MSYIYEYVIRLIDKQCNTNMNVYFTNNINEIEEKKYIYK